MQENKPVMNTFPSESVFPSVTASQPVYEKPKTNNFLLILLSVLLFVSVSIAGFFAYQTQVLVKELYTLKTLPTPVRVQLETTSKPDSTSSATPESTASWKVYDNGEFSFKYPDNWVVGPNGKQLTSTKPQITLWSFPTGDPMYNECMKLDSTVTEGKLMIKRYSRVTTGEMCGTTDSTPREIWITKANSDGYAPGIQFEYKSTDDIEVQGIFDQIASTFKFKV